MIVNIEYVVINKEETVVTRNTQETSLMNMSILYYMNPQQQNGSLTNTSSFQL